MKMFIASNSENTFNGSFNEICEKIGVSRQYAHRCYTNDKPCRGYDISMFYASREEKLTKRELLKQSIELLKRCRLIIDEENAKMCEHGEYANIGIIEDIDRFLSNINRTAPLAP